MTFYKSFGGIHSISWKNGQKSVKNGWKNGQKCAKNGCKNGQKCAKTGWKNGQIARLRRRRAPQPR